MSRSRAALRGRVVSLILLALVTTACGGSSPAAPSGSSSQGSGSSGGTSGGTGSGGTTTPGGTGGGTSATTGTFTALIDGGSFNGALGLTAINANNQLSVSGSNGQYTLQLIVILSRGAGTYTFGSVDASNVTTAALALNGTGQTWIAGPTQGSGSITISSLTSTSVTGTFTVTLPPSVGGPATGNRVITSGVFNVPLSASTTVPPSIPSGPPTPTGTPAGILATIDGEEWRPLNGGQATRTAQGFVTIAGADLQARAFSIAILASAVGTYSLNNPASHNALYASGTQTWFTSRPGGGGSVTITSISTTRVAGTFTMTLAPSQGNTDQRTVQITAGFDLAF